VVDINERFWFEAAGLGVSGRDVLGIETRTKTKEILLPMEATTELFSA